MKNILAVPTVFGKKQFSATALPAFLSVAVLSGATSADAATFTPMFDTPIFPGTYFDVDSDPDYNDFYSLNFGITAENAYLYVDSRDAFDGIGLANGHTTTTGSYQSGRINFLDTTDFVTIDYIAGRAATYNAFASDGSLVDSFSSIGGNLNGTEMLSGGIISYVTFSGDGGWVAISGLTYDYDGTTDGTNTDLDSVTVSAVPLPAGLPLILTGFLGFGLVSRRS